MTIFSVHDQYVGAVEESVYATGLAVSRFYEYTSETLAGTYSRIESSGMRAGAHVERVDRWAPNPKGATGEIKSEVLDSGFGLLFKHMLGSFSAGTAVSGWIPYTYTMGNLAGLSSTWQVGRVATDGSINPFTYEGGKVKTWELSNDVDGVLNFSVDLDFAKETIGAGSGAYALSTPTYPSTAQLMTYIGGTCSVAGTTFAIKGATIKGDNKLDVTRYFLNSLGIKKEPLEEEFRTVEWELKAEFDSLTQIRRVASATAAGAMASIVLGWQSPQGGSLVATMPNARFDTGPVHADNKVSLVTLSGHALDDGGSPGPIGLVYTTKDTAP